MLTTAPLADAAARAGHAGATTTQATIGGNPVDPTLPHTDLEFDQRGGGGSQWPYILWSGAASAVVLTVGGLWFKRRFDRENRPTS